MKILVFLTGLLSVLLWSCEKTVPVDLTDYDEPRLVAEGRISPENSIQKLKITWTSNLGSETADPADDVLPEIQTPGGTILFNSTGAGNYESMTAFAGIPGALYTVKFLRQGVLHEASTQMPHALDISSFTMYMSPELTMETNPDIYLTLTTPVDQFFRFELYKLSKTHLPDTVWTKIEIPVYNTYPVSAGSNSLLIDQSNLAFHYFEKEDVARIIVHSLSDDIAAYLDKLKEFMTYEPKGGRYENPPYYFSNEAYGLVYGSVTDTALFTF